MLSEIFEADLTIPSSVNTSTSVPHGGGECQHFQSLPELGHDRLVGSKLLQLAEKEHALLGFPCDGFSIDVPLYCVGNSSAQEFE